MKATISIRIDDNEDRSSCSYTITRHLESSNSIGELVADAINAVSTEIHNHEEVLKDIDAYLSDDFKPNKKEEENE